MSNGLRVSVVEDRTRALTAMSFVVKAGGIQSPPGKDGLPVVVSNLLASGGAARSEPELLDLLSGLGIALTNAVYPTYTTLDFECTSDKLPMAMDILADIILRPRFGPQDVAKVKEKRLARLRQRRATGPFIAEITVYSRTFPGHAAAVNSFGTEAGLNAIDEDDVGKYFRTYVVPTNTVLVISGPVDAETVKKQLEERVGSWRPEASPIPALAALPQTSSSGIVVVNSPGVTSVTIGVALRGPAPDSPERPSVDVAASVVKTRLSEDLANGRGWAYFQNASLVEIGPATILYARANVNPAHAVEAVSVIKDIVRQAAQQMTEEEVDAAKRALLLDVIKSYATSRGTVDAIVARLALGHGPSVPISLTAADAQTALDRILRAEPVIVLVGPVDVLGPQLEEAGMTKFEVLQR